MEIPYIVKARKDTGLTNSKIAIWLFLASEVMLFGGFFSAYVFMRIGADYPWPERTLPILPGLINTFILIASSVTVVFAWAALKLRKWRQFQIFMGATVLCAVIFMCLKAVEYNVKFHHQAVRLNDYSIIEGHLDYIEVEDEHGSHGEHGAHGLEYNVINIESSEIIFSILRERPDSWVEDMLEQAKHHGSKIVLKDDYKGADGLSDKDKVYFKAGTELSVGLLEKIKAQHRKAKARNQELRTDALGKAWDVAFEKNPGKKGWEISDKVLIDEEALKPKMLTELGAVAFSVDPPAKLHFKPKNIKEADGQSRLRDDTVIVGKLLESPMKFHHVDAIDFQYLAMKAVQKGIDPMVAIENSWIIQNVPFAKEAWVWHCEEVAKEAARLEKKYGYDDNGKPNREPTLKERYRIGWKEFAIKAEQEGITNMGDWTIMEEFKGPDYKARGEKTFPHLSVPRGEIAFASKFVPQWNTYYAIYFTITGLHGLHVIGGALVLAYYLFFGRKMYETNPEWLANRVEVGGLFWHFVDLIWIFAFPIFYLM